MKKARFRPDLGLAEIHLVKGAVEAPPALALPAISDDGDDEADRETSRKKPRRTT
jgi:hypothetical protein